MQGSCGAVLEADAGAAVAIGEVAQPSGVVAQALAQRAGDAACLLVQCGGAAVEAGGVRLASPSNVS
ncbi:hypothetical protein GCM10009863_08710 [Streptomyces axinellae]|uniref:Uncharacterized protein n=1 Tax=Streptomyces axinellae TaxID=552788 RepID=A0ABN3PQE6_9ACTN